MNRITVALLRACPTKLVQSKESVEELVVKDEVDFSTGVDTIGEIEEEQAKTTDVSVSEDNIGSESIKFTVPEGITTKTLAESIISKVVLSTSSDDDVKKFLALCDSVNEQFTKMFNDVKYDIVRSVNNIVEITGSSTDTAKEIAECIKKNNIKYVD